MSVIKVNINNVRNENTELLLIREEISKSINEIEKIRNSLTIDTQNEIDERLCNVSKQLFQLEDKVDSLYKMINYSMDMYSQNEYRMSKQGNEIC